MEASGKVIAVCDPETGVSKAGNNWKKRTCVIETQETYPKKIAFTLFGDRMDQYPMNVGDMVKVSFDISSREYNGRWYTDISAWKVEPATAAPAAGPVGDTAGIMPGGYAQAPVPPANLAPSGDDEELPF